MVGAFALCRFSDGEMIYESMSVKDIQSVRNNYSNAKDSKAWKNSFDEMCKKTVLRRLCKHIDTDFDSAEARAAWEEGSGFTFKKEEPGQIVSNPFENSDDDGGAIDVDAVEVDTTPPDDFELPFK